MGNQKIIDCAINLGRYTPLLPIIAVGFLLVLSTASVMGIVSQNFPIYIGEMLGIVSDIFLNLLILFLSFIVLKLFNDQECIGEKEVRHLSGTFAIIAAGFTLLTASWLFEITEYSPAIFDIKYRSMELRDLLDAGALILGVAYVAFGIALFECRKGYKKGVAGVSLAYIVLGTISIFGWLISLGENHLWLGTGGVLVLGCASIIMTLILIYLIGKYLFVNIDYEGKEAQQKPYLTDAVKFLALASFFLFILMVYAAATFLKEPLIKNIAETLYFIVYLLPIFLAKRFNVKGVGMIALVNIFLGWTVVGWLASLYMVYSSRKTYSQCTSCLGHIGKSANRCMHCGESIAV